jgi:hypothetical protein
VVEDEERMDESKGKENRTRSERGRELAIMEMNTKA